MWNENINVFLHFLPLFFTKKSLFFRNQGKKLKKIRFLKNTLFFHFRRQIGGVCYYETPCISIESYCLYFDMKKILIYFWTIIFDGEQTKWIGWFRIITLHSNYMPFWRAVKFSSIGAFWNILWVSSGRLGIENENAKYQSLDLSTWLHDKNIKS